jgi:hypothetical protein
METAMDQETQDLRDLLRMATLLKGAAGRALFQDCSVVFLGVAELLERRAGLIAEEAQITQLEQAPPLPRRPVNIVT